MAVAMDTATCKEKYRWIQLKHTISPTDWAEFQCGTYGDPPRHDADWGFLENIKFTLKPHESDGEFSKNGNYLHDTVELEVYVMTSDKTDYADLTLCYLPRSTQEKDEFLKELREDSSRKAIYKSFKNGCRSYIWIFDICLVTMIFRNASDKTRMITKNFHLECTEARYCGDVHNNIASEVDELFRITKSEFLTKAELEKVIGYKMDYNHEYFVPVELEFRARLHLRPITDDFQILDPDDKCILSPSDNSTNLFESEKLVSPSIIPFASKNKYKRTFFEMDSDVTFEIKSASSTVTMNAHSWVLAVRSPVFRQMLTTEMLEKKTGIIKLGQDEASQESLKLFLTFLYYKTGWSYSHEDGTDQDPKYTSVDDWNAEISFKVLQLAHKYVVTDLIEFCIENIISRPDSEFTLFLAVQIFKGGMLYEMDDLKCRCAEWIKRQTKTVKTELKELLSEDSSAVACEFLSYPI